MRRPLIAAAFLILLLGPAASPAFAINIRDLLALSKEGVGDAVLVAIIETDGSRFALGPSEVRDLRVAGLSDTVIVAMLMTARTPTTPTLSPQRPVPEILEVDPPAIAEPPRYDARRPSPVIIQQTIVQKVEVPVIQREMRAEPVYVPVYIPVVSPRLVETKKEEPVYWGWGGKRRPDAWKEDPSRR